MSIGFDLESIKKVYEMLEDEESKKIYMLRLAYSISNSKEYLYGLQHFYLKKMIFAADGHLTMASLLSLLPQDQYYYLKKTMFEADGHLTMASLLSLLPQNQNYVLYGAGRDGAKLLDHVRSDKRFIGFCSRTKEKQQHGYMGFPVMSPEELLARKDLGVIISTSIYRYDIMQLLKDGGYPQELIFDGPSYYLELRNEAEQYFGPAFIKFGKDEVFIDVGCFDFGSSLTLAKHCGHIKKVYAFEPEPTNYQRCLEAIENRDRKQISDVQLFPNGAWSQEATLSFFANRGSGSTVCAGTDSKESISISAIPIDSVIAPEDRVTMIKMDIEGSELEALKGARETILRDHPRLAICIYHKPEDIFEIPLYIKDLVPEYRLYIRHHSLEVFETVLYAVMPE